MSLYAQLCGARFKEMRRSPDGAASVRFVGPDGPNGGEIALLADTLDALESELIRALTGIRQLRGADAEAARRADEAHELEVV